MTPTSPLDTPRSYRLVAGLSFVALIALVAMVALGVGSSGCSKPPPPPPPDPNTVKGKPWEVAAVRLRKDTDIAACKAALGGLTSDLASSDDPKPVALTEEALGKINSTVPLSPSDREEIRGASFSSHDSVYLADCFYMRDAARSLALMGQPPERQVELAFAWVCRQVYLNPWLQQLGPQTFATTALPPTAILRRGYGSGLERMYVFISLLQQLELDGCLIGRPDAGPSTTQFHVNSPVTKPEELAAVVAIAPRGPFWAVGVRIGNDVKLFDPWRGEPFPVMLSQLKAKPESAKAWFEDKANVSGATLEDAKNATVYLAVPVNSLSSRMASFDANLKKELGVKTAYDPVALQFAFPDPKPKFWNPLDDPFAYGRTARSFLPLEEGGSDRSPTGARLFDAYTREQIPPSVFTTRPSELQEPEAIDRLRIYAAVGLKGAFLDPPNPRERIQRGQFHDAAKDLVSKQQAFAGGLERLRNSKDTEKQIQEWCETANTLHQELSNSRLSGTSKDAQQRAQAAVENHWQTGAAAQLLIDQASAEIGQAEATYLLALCKHEQAERAQARLERATSAELARLKADALDAWQTALAQWQSYQQMAGVQKGFPGRIAHANLLITRAEKLAELLAKEDKK
ncbi:MAG: hypothetical protein L0241_03165 [Planctomycetia bacterium]|nr:hypothetical protein [Planctomycetia bacterium]